MTDKSNLPVPRKNDGALALKKTKNLMALVDRMLATAPSALAVVDDDSWMERLWAWADETGIPEDTLPRNKTQLLQLTRLDLTSFEFDEDFSTIERFDPLTILPPEIGQLTQLTKLALGGNDLTGLPPEIGQLTQLTMLDLGNNRLTELPPEIWQLPQLTDLRLTGNRLTELPPGIGQLTQLTDLWLACNRLTELPPEIGQLTQLNWLELAFNPISETAEVDKIRRLLPNCDGNF